LGRRAKTLVDLYLLDPKAFRTEFAIEQLLDEYEKQGLEIDDM